MDGGGSVADFAAGGATSSSISNNLDAFAPSASLVSSSCTERHLFLQHLPVMYATYALVSQGALQPLLKPMGRLQKPASRATSTNCAEKRA